MTKTSVILFTFFFFLIRVSGQDSTQRKVLDQVVITASKYPAKTSTTGKVIQVVTREQLSLAGGKDLSQVLTEQTGVYINGATSSAGKDKTVFIRGAKGDYTLIMIDGVPIYDASGIGGNFDIRLIPIDQVERIEILKGSQSTLYGSDAMAGVVNIITRKATLRPLQVSGVFNAGSYGTHREAINMAGRNGKVDYSAGYTNFKTNGIDETTDSTNGQTLRDKDGYKQHGFLANLGWQPGSKVSIRPYIRYTKSNADIDNGAFTDELDNNAVQKNLQTGLQGTVMIGKGKLNLLFNYNTIDRTYIDDSVRSQNGYYRYSRGEYLSREQYAEAYYVVGLLEQLKLTAGVDYRRSHTDQQTKSVDMFGTYDGVLDGDSVKQHQVGGYVSLNLHTAAGFSFEAGGRYNNHSTYGSNLVYSINPSFLLHKRYKIFANFSSAYKTPGLYQLFSEYGNRGLKPESGNTIEAGLQYFDPNERFTARAVYFDRSLREVLFFAYNTSTSSFQYINQDKQHDHGIETEATIQFSKVARLQLNYTYVTGNISTVNNGKDTSYFNLLRRPKSTFGSTLSVQPMKRLTASINLQAFGQREDVTFDPNTFASVPVVLKPFTLLNLYAEYSFLNARLHIFADIRNVTNADYEEVYGYNTAGFNAYGGLRFNL